MPPVLWFLIKVYALVLLFYWFRGTFPRLRIDQLMGLAWKVFVPLSFINLIFTASYRFYDWPGWVLSFLGLGCLVLIFLAGYRKVASQNLDASIRLIPAREVRRAE